MPDRDPTVRVYSPVYLTGRILLAIVFLVISVIIAVMLPFILQIPCQHLQL
jgi:hypothetical protein